MQEPHSNRFEKHHRLTFVGVCIVLLIAADFLLGSLFFPGIEGAPHPYYNHDLKRNYHRAIPWGNRLYFVYTDNLGFRDDRVRTIDLRTDKRRVAFIGDSFTKGSGIEYPDTFVGRIRKALGDQYEVLNLAASSYSPKLYYLKTKYWLEQGLDIDELNVFIDISDIQDEILYKDFEPSSRYAWSNIVNQITAFWEQHSVLAAETGTASLLSRLTSTANVKNRLMKRDYNDIRSLWTIDEKSYAEWGREGLALAVANMEKLYELANAHHIALTIAVYPWPIQIERGDVHSRQVEVWQQFAQERNLRFLNYFPDFINAATSSEVVRNYFIDGDIHWNEAGHALVAEKWLSEYQKGKNIGE